MYTDNINLTDLFYFEVEEKCFAICGIVISFTFNEALSCQKCSLYSRGGGGTLGISGWGCAAGS